MASNTSNLNLLKKDPLTDGKDTFNIRTMLNENWDKIDEFAGETTPISRGGTGATTAEQARVNLGITTQKYFQYSSFADIGLNSGSETIEAILNAMPNGSILRAEIGGSNASIYPTQYGLSVFTKVNISRFFGTFYPKDSYNVYTLFAKIENDVFSTTGWAKTGHKIEAGTTDITAGASSLTTDDMYLVYE